MNEEFETLWQEFLDGGLGAEGFARLDAMLRGDAALARHAADLYEEHRLLGLALRAEAPGRFETATLARLARDREQFSARLRERLPAAAPRAPAARRGWRRAGAIGALAAALVAAPLLMVWAFVPAVKPAAVPPVATLLHAEAGMWPAPRLNGELLPAGLIELRGGSAVLRFDSGTMVVLTGPTVLQLESRGGAFLRRGQVTVRAPDEAQGFVLRTAHGDIVSQGAEFGATAEPAGETRVHALEGDATIRGAAGALRRVPAGQALRLDRPGESETIAAGAPRLADLVQALRRAARPVAAEVHEGFDYARGEAAPGRMDGGTGWRGPWRRREGAERMHGEDTPPGPAVTDGLPAHGAVAIGGALEFPAGHNVWLRALAHGIDLGRDGVHYVSLRVWREAAARPGEPAPSLDAIRLTLRASRDYWGPTVSFALRPRQQPQIACGPGVTFNSPQSFPAGETLILVGKIFARAKTEDEIFLRVFAAGEIPGPWEPAEWTLGTRGIFSDATLDRVLLTGSGSSRCRVDELRIGATWDAVMPRAAATAMNAAKRRGESGQ
jgi:hypothetical protein